MKAVHRKALFSTITTEMSCDTLLLCHPKAGHWCRSHGTSEQ